MARIWFSDYSVFVSSKRWVISKEPFAIFPEWRRRKNTHRFLISHDDHQNVALIEVENLKDLAASFHFETHLVQWWWWLWMFGHAGYTYYIIIIMHYFAGKLQQDHPSMYVCDVEDLIPTIGMDGWIPTRDGKLHMYKQRHLPTCGLTLYSSIYFIYI